MSDPHSENLRLHRLKDASSTFFVTKSLKPKKTGSFFRIQQSRFRRLCVRGAARTHLPPRIRVMPDHWHALLGLCEPWTLPKFMHSFMSHVGARTSAHLAKNQPAWQDGYYETLIKSARQFTYVTI